jgi:hypothetical protein
MGCSGSKQTEENANSPIDVENARTNAHHQLPEDHGVNYGSAPESDLQPSIKDEYEGDMKNGKKWGQGKCNYSDGSFYEGAFENNKKHGKGLYKASNGDIYEGDFKDGLR